MEVAKMNLKCNNFEEISSVLQKGLEANFKTVRVSVVDCPDLSNYGLTSSGLGGQSCLADVGGPKYLVPTPRKEKIYNIEEICRLCDKRDAFALGAGAGPFHDIGVLCENMIDYTVCNGSVTKNNCYISKVGIPDGNIIVEKTNTPEYGLMSNLYLSDGKKDKVLEVILKTRIGPDNFMSSIRKTLLNHYGDKPIGLGGIFIVEKGSTKIHVMPDFSTCPLNSDEEANQWLKFYEIDVPMLFMGDLVTCDPEGLNLRLEHFHGWSFDKKYGGHYHYDTTPETVEYKGYLSLAETLYRID